MADLAKLHTYVDKRIEQIEAERADMYRRLPLVTPLEALVTRVNEQEETIHALLHRVAALEDLLQGEGEE